MSEDRTIESHWTLPEMAKQIGATPADIPGLWDMPGYPELTTGQLVGVWLSRAQP